MLENEEKLFLLKSLEKYLKMALSDLESAIKSYSKPEKVEKPSVKPDEVPPNTGTDEKLLNEKEAAIVLSCSCAWLRQGRMRGDGPKFVKLGRNVRYRMSDLNLWIENNLRTNTLIRRQIKGSQ